MTTSSIVFISYSQKDAEFVNPFAALLLSYGLNVWKDTKDIAIGGNIPKSIYEGIKSASHFCCIISQWSVRSAWVEEELTFAKMRQLHDQSLQIIPVLVDDVEIPDYVRALRCAHLENRILSPRNPEFAVLLRALGVALKSKESYVVTGTSRQELIEASRELFNAVDHLRIEFRAYRTYYEMADAASSVDRPRRYGSEEEWHLRWIETLLPTSKNYSERANGKWKYIRTYARTERIQQAWQTLEEVAIRSGLKEFPLWVDLYEEIPYLKGSLEVDILKQHIAVNRSVQAHITSVLSETLRKLERLRATFDSWEIFEMQR